MTGHRSLLHTITVLLVFAFMSTTSRAENPRDITDIIKRSFKVNQGGTLFLDVDQGGVEVTTRRGSEVLIEIELTVDVDDRTKAKEVMESYRSDFDQRGNDIFVRSRFDKTEGFWGRIRDASKVKIHITARIPEQYNVDFRSGFGSVRINDLDGNVNGRTGAGEIEIGMVSGTVDISTGTGHVEVDGAANLFVKTGAGNIHARNVKGKAEVNTGAGDIEVEITSQPEEDSHLVTGAGSVTVLLEDDIAMDIEAQTNMGSAITDFPLRVETNFIKKSFGGPINGGGPLLRIRAGIGSVELKRI